MYVIKLTDEFCCIFNVHHVPFDFLSGGRRGAVFRAVARRHCEAHLRVLRTSSDSYETLEYFLKLI